MSEKLNEVRLTGFSDERLLQMDNTAKYYFNTRNSWLKKEIIKLLDSIPDHIKNPKEDD